MPDITTFNGIDMADIASINGQDAPSGGGGTASTTPTLSGLADGYTVYSFTVGNHASYTTPSYYVEVHAGGAAIIADSAITKSGGTISWSDTSSTSGTRTVKLRAQEFGDNIQSAEVTDTYTKTDIDFRYYRVKAVTSGGGNTTAHMGVKDWGFYTAASYGGTKYPTNMTSDTAPSPFVAMGNTYNTTTYAKYKAFDSSTTSWAWTLTKSNDLNYVQIDMGASPPTLASSRMKFYSGSSNTHVTVSGSNSSDFSSGVTVFLDAFEIDKSGEPYNVIF